MIEYSFQIQQLGTIYGDKVNYNANDKMLVIKLGENIAGIIMLDYLELYSSDVTNLNDIIQKEYIFTIKK